MVFLARGNFTKKVEQTLQVFILFCMGQHDEITFALFEVGRVFWKMKSLSILTKKNCRCDNAYYTGGVGVTKK